MAGEELSHQTVLLQEAVEGLAVKPAGVYIDGTFGRGGHSRAILERLGPDGRLMAIDKDPQAVGVAEAQLAGDQRFSIRHGSFVMLAQVAEQEAVKGKVDGVLLDLGVSSPQLDDAARGFSFLQDGPLDMRMNPEAGVPAWQWLSGADEREIARVLWEYGEERHSRRIARAIVAARQHSHIRTTRQLAELIEGVMPKREKHKHPATRSFQAIRIVINRELEDLEHALEQVPQTLAPGGRLVVISFHSLEDRLVKRFMRRESQGKKIPRGLPVKGEPEGRSLRVVGKAVRAGEAEIAANPRARSAIMRVAERLA